MLEEQKMQLQNDLEDEGYLTAYTSIPYFLIEDEVGSDKRNEYFQEFAEIAKYYDIYKKGSRFIAEGSNLDYVPSDLKYKKAAMILNKEARFLFSNPPTFNVNKDDVDGKYKQDNAIIQDYVDKVLEKTDFDGKIMKAVKDCFIGKRVAAVVNFNEVTGITVTFLNSLEFVYEFSKERENELVKFATFYKLDKSDVFEKQRWFKKRYTKESDGVYLEEYIYDGTGKVIEIVTRRTKIKLDYIPATVILNDGLTGETKGESELGGIYEYEKYFSKLANADMDAERKSMNPIRYTIDASQGSTKVLSTSPGSYWDLQSDDEKTLERNAKVGTLEAQMNYSGPLKTTLERIENEMYSELDVPNITSEQLAGVITSGKTIQALYWGLTVRCDEKMLAWGYSLRQIAYAIIDGGIVYPECIKEYTDAKRIPEIPYNVIVENNYPIPEDVKDEKETDLSEIDAKVLSRKSYLKKWRKLNDEEADKEIQQIKLEQELLENSVVGYNFNDNVNVDDTDGTQDGSEDGQEPQIGTENNDV